MFIVVRVMMFDVVREDSFDRSGATASSNNASVLMFEGHPQRIASVGGTTVITTTTTTSKDSYSNFSISPVLLYNISLRDRYTIRTLEQHACSRAQLLPTTNDEELNMADFQRDVLDAHFQLSVNFDEATTSCRSNPWKVSRCYGIGTTMLKFAIDIGNRRQRRISIIRADDFSCDWFANDQTKNCSRIFDDCYFPALTRGRVQHQQGGQARKCYSTVWFRKKYNSLAYLAMILSWLVGDSMTLQLHDDGNNKSILPTATAKSSSACIAVHIRRGDACINLSRRCFSYEDYIHAVQVMLHLNPHLDRLVLLTDAHDLPLERFQHLVPHVWWNGNANQSVYNVEHLRKNDETFGSWSPNASWSPENRDMGNAASDFLTELQEASKCEALVGSFTSAVTKWLFLVFMIRLGRVPVFYSVDGCIQTLLHVNADDDECETRFLSLQNGS